MLQEENDSDDNDDGDDRDDRDVTEQGNKAFEVVSD